MMLINANVFQKRHGIYSQGDEILHFVVLQLL